MQRESPKILVVNVWSSMSVVAFHRSPAIRALIVPFSISTDALSRSCANLAVTLPLSRNAVVPLAPRSAAPPTSTFLNNLGGNLNILQQPRC